MANRRQNIVRDTSPAPLALADVLGRRRVWCTEDEELVAEGDREVRRLRQNRQDAVLDVIEDRDQEDAVPEDPVVRHRRRLS